MSKLQTQSVFKDSYTCLHCIAFHIISNRRNSRILRLFKNTHISEGHLLQALFLSNISEKKEMATNSVSLPIGKLDSCHLFIIPIGSVLNLV